MVWFANLIPVDWKTCSVIEREVNVITFEERRIQPNDEAFTRPDDTVIKSRLRVTYGEKLSLNECLRQPCPEFEQDEHIVV